MKRLNITIPEEINNMLRDGPLTSFISLLYKPQV